MNIKFKTLGASILLAASSFIPSISHAEPTLMTSFLLTQDSSVEELFIDYKQNLIENHQLLLEKKVLQEGKNYLVFNIHNNQAIFEDGIIFKNSMNQPIDVIININSSNNSNIQFIIDKSGHITQKNSFEKDIASGEYKISFDSDYGLHPKNFSDAATLLNNREYILNSPIQNAKYTWQTPDLLSINNVKLYSSKELNLLDKDESQFAQQLIDDSNKTLLWISLIISIVGVSAFSGIFLSKDKNISLKPKM